MTIAFMAQGSHVGSTGMYALRTNPIEDKYKNTIVQRGQLRCKLGSLRTGVAQLRTSTISAHTFVVVDSVKIHWWQVCGVAARVLVRAAWF